MSRIGRELAMFRTAFVNEGFFPGTECLFRELGGRLFGMSPVGHPRANLVLYGITDLVYDRLHGVDTRGVIELPEMENRGRSYVGTPPRAWKLMMRHIAIDPARFTYLDLGCGKGRTLLLAAQGGFRRILGLDISSQLLQIAEHNLRSASVEGELICRDVTEYEFPPEPLVVFMYNPFYAEVMEKVAVNLRRSLNQTPRECYIMYYSAAFDHIWRDAGFRVMRRSDATYPNYVIYDGLQ